jgi:PII-like signaling protein
VLTVVVDTPERIGRAFAVVDEVTRDAGLVTSEMVPAAAAPSAGPPGTIGLARHRFGV